MTNEERKDMLNDLEVDYLKITMDVSKLLRDVKNDQSLDPALRAKAVGLIAKFAKIDAALDEIKSLLALIDGKNECVELDGKHLAEAKKPSNLDEIGISVFVTLPEKELIDSEYVSKTLKYALDEGDLKEDGEFAELTGTEALAAITELDNAMPLYRGKDATVLGGLRKAIAEELEKYGVFAADDGKKTTFRDASGNEIGFSIESSDGYVDYIDW